jgi:hypothetical protein
MAVRPCSFQASQAQRVHSDRLLEIKTPSEETHTIQFSLVSNSAISKEEFYAFHEHRARQGLSQISKREVRTQPCPELPCQLSTTTPSQLGWRADTDSMQPLRNLCRVHGIAATPRDQPAARLSPHVCCR